MQWLVNAQAGKAIAVLVRHVATGLVVLLVVLGQVPGECREAVREVLKPFESSSLVPPTTWSPPASVQG